MPQEIKFQQGETSYLYDASGVKLRVKHKTANSSVNIPLTNTRNFEESEFLSTLTTDYIGNKVYEDGKLKMILNPEGYTAYYSGYWGTESKTDRYHIKDYLGSVRVVLDNSESTEQLHYYAFGMPFSNRNLNQPYIHPNGLVERFKYIGKEFDSMHGLDTYDHGARQYDGMRWPTMDLLAEKYYSISPYVYCGNDPINRIDPNGMDWYTDEDGTYQYDPNLSEDNQSKILKKGQKYVGATYQVKGEKGNITENYRADGSIMFSSESRGYKRIWNNSQKTGKEEMGVITDKGVLVLPSYKNNGSTVDLSDYGYSAKNGNIVDSKGTEYNTTATVHTHPNGSEPSTYVVTGYGDLGFASFTTPYEPVYVLQMNGQNAISFIVAAPNVTKKSSDFNYLRYNITNDYPGANPSNLLKGNFSLYQYTRSNNFRKILK